MGLLEVVRELPRIRGILRVLVEEARRRRPRVAVLLDSPDFNLRLAARLRPLGIPVVLYISPQLWAWRQGRVRVVRRLASEVLCILPFEPGFYEEHGVPARYVGHPLVDDLAREGLYPRPESNRQRSGLALLPGSRAMEVRSLLPTMLEALHGLDEVSLSDVVLLEAPGLGPVIDEVVDRYGREVAVERVSGADRRLALARSAVAWTASGTATLECALVGTPMVVGYRLQPLSYALARWLVRVPHVALANLIAGSRVVPELIQSRWRADRLRAETRQLIGPRGGLIANGLELVRRRLGQPGASQRAAEAVAEYLL
jgi:lipid-A-disaccharide synthase